MTRYSEALRGNDLAEALEGLIERANAALPRVTGLSSSTEPASRLGPSGFDPLSQINRDGSAAEKAAPAKSSGD